MAKSTFDKSVEKVSAEFNKVEDEVKDTAENIGSWWNSSSFESRCTMIVGIVLLIWALVKLKTILWWIVLLILGILAVTWHFDGPLKDLIIYCKKHCKDRSKIVKSTARAKKENEK